MGHFNFYSWSVTDFLRSLLVTDLLRVKGARLDYFQPVEASAVVFLAKEARLAIVPALHDVQRYAIKVDTRAAGHGSMLAV